MNVVDADKVVGVARAVGVVSAAVAGATEVAEEERAARMVVAEDAVDRVEAVEVVVTEENFSGMVIVEGSSLSRLRV